MQGHGLIVLKNLLEERDEETLQNREKVMNIFMKCIEYQETYVHQPSINGLAILATLDTGCVFPNVLRQYQLSEDRDTVLKLGEVLRKTTDLLGESVYKFKDALLHAFLIGTKREDPQIRSSNLSNLGQACFHLKCNIGSDWLQEILNCVVSFLKTDSDLEVRKCAVMVIELLLRGVDINIFMVLESELKNIYTQLKIVYMNETDEFILLRAQIALGIINEIMIKLFTSKDALIKEIHILQ
ncbi:transport and Golgi organization protein 6 homolog [Caerostris darwini]|uniref:Transport and Golgi organization protein 6 homolog n=1 Tax=Caerostris darwini TaxID=1538125 RepID=A0AAV4VIB5_9ARAC|nr:transport and Golgi organization protein 6 homolog [Caerostris darwini]